MNTKMVTIVRYNVGGRLTELFFQNRDNAIEHLCKVAHTCGHDISAEKRQKIKESYPYKVERIKINGIDDVLGDFVIELESRDYYDK